MAKKPETKVETTNEKARDIFEMSLDAIRDEIRAIKAGKIITGPTDPVVRTAQLAKRAAEIVAEQRKLDKLERQALLQLTPANVLAWARLQSADLRGRLVRDVQNIDSKRSVLAL